MAVIEYQKGTSTLHRLDARTKILLFIGMTILAVIIVDPVLIAVLFLILYWFGREAVDPKLLNRNLRVLVVIFFTFSLFQIFFFTPKDAHFLFYLIPKSHWIPVTVQGIIRGIAVFFRFFIVVLSVHLMLYTTPPVDLVLAMTRRERNSKITSELGGILGFGALLFAVALLAFPDQIQRIQTAPAPRLLILSVAALIASFVIYRVANHGLPPEMGVALSLGFATVGILSQQTQKITDAQKARGYDVQPKNLIRRVQVLTALLLPIFLATMERSQDISVAILARAFDYNIAKRTFRRQLVFHQVDYLVIGILAFLLLVSLAMKYWGIDTFSEQFILNLLKP
jgi:energy-coupling factor transporter transmembrane protein EcfT